MRLNSEARSLLCLPLFRGVGVSLKQYFGRRHWPQQPAWCNLHWISCLSPYSNGSTNQLRAHRAPV